MGAYDGLKRDELVALCEERGLPTDGVKAELIARLEATDVDLASGEADDVLLGVDPSADDSTADDSDDPVESDAISTDAEIADDLPGSMTDDATGAEMEDDAPEAAESDAAPEALEDRLEDVAAEAIGSAATALAGAALEVISGHEHPALDPEDLANHGRAPNKRGVQPWDAMKVEILGQLRAGAQDVWQDGEDLDWLAGVAEDWAKQKWRALNGDHLARRNATTNLRHLEAQVAGRVAQIRMRLAKGGDDILIEVLRVVLKAVIGALL